MKRSILFLLLIALFIYGCTKTEETVSPQKQFNVAISPTTISEQSDWVHVLGGDAIITFQQYGNLIKDSLNLTSVSLFSKKIVEGKYDVSLATKSQSIADTFIRFNAAVKDYVIDKDINLNFQCITTDGLITIGKDLVKENTTPIFIASTDNKQVKFGLVNGYFYLYVKGGVTGKIYFTEKETKQSLVKDITVITGNQYNLKVLKHTASSISVIFSQFTYNEVPVVSPCPYVANPSLLAFNWINTKIITQYHSNNEWIFSNKIEPVGYFKLKSDGTYDRVSDNVPLYGSWEVNSSNCNLLLDKGTGIERSFEILKADQDSLVMSRIEGNYKYIQYYYKNN